MKRLVLAVAMALAASTSGGTGLTTAGLSKALADSSYLKLDSTNTMSGSTINFGTLGFAFNDSNSNTIQYLSGTGPRFVDGTSAGGVTLNMQSVLASRTWIAPNANTSIPVIPQTITITGPTAARTWTVPDASFSIARSEAAQTFTGAQTFTNGIVTGTGTSRYGIDVYTNSSHWANADVDSGGYISSNGTGQLLMWGGANQLSGTYTAKTTAAEGIELRNNTLSFYSNTGLTAGNPFTPTLQFRVSAAGLIDEYAGAATAGQGVAPILGAVSLTTQAASITTTSVLASAAAGEYRVCWDQQITQAATNSSSIQTTIGWNNGSAKTSTLASLNGGALQTTADASNTLNSEMSNCLTIWSAASQNITYATTYSSTGVTPMQYALRVTVHRLQ